jgi:DNA-binding transcriptional MerR regulator
MLFREGFFVQKDLVNLVRSLEDTALGFTLNEIDEFIEAWAEESASCSNLTTHLTDKINRVDQQIKLLQEIRSKLTGSLDKCLSDNCEFEKMIPRCIGNC